MKWDKEFYVTSAVYRMLYRGCITKDKAVTLLCERAKAKHAKATVEIWLANHQFRTKEQKQ